MNGYSIPTIEVIDPQYLNIDELNQIEIELDDEFNNIYNESSIDEEFDSSEDDEFHDLDSFDVNIDEHDSMLDSIGNDDFMNDYPELRNR